MWARAIKLVLPDIDLDVLEYLDDKLRDVQEIDEDQLEAIIGADLRDLLNFKDEQVIFTCMDIISSYGVEDVVLEEEVRSTSCELCDREMFLTIHHLFPRSEHEYILKHPPFGGITKRDLLVKHRAWLCRPCHSAIHRIVSNRDLATSYCTVDKLMDLEEVRKWVGYASKQKATRQNRTGAGLKWKKCECNCM